MKRVKTKIITTLLAVTMAFSLTACGDKPCEHTYDNACDITCNECNEERTVAHDWNAADCDTPKTCSICGITDGNALGHTPNADDGNCTTAIVCSVCGTITTEAKETHTPNADDGDCTTAIVCSVCGTGTTEAKETHTPNADDGNCLTEITCSVCGTVTTEGKTAHDFSEIAYVWADDYSTCTAEIECEYCEREITETAKSSYENGITTAVFENNFFETQNVILTYADSMTADVLTNAVTSLITKGETEIYLDFGDKYYFGDNSFNERMSVIVNEAMKASAAVDGSINVTIKGENAGTSYSSFYSNPKLKTVTLLDAVELGEYCFDDCKNLTAVYLPSATSFIGATFYNCPALTTVELTALGEFTTESGGNEGTIFISDDDLSNINLVLNADKQGDVFGNTWEFDGMVHGMPELVSFTFKSITFAK